jgi:hypothetical protein
MTGNPHVHAGPSPGDAVARAKRTARAEARRRYRADQPASVETPLADDPPDPRPRDRTVARATPAPTGRRSFAGAFRDAFRPLDLRGDLQALPRIALRTNALWIPVALTLLSLVLFLVIRPEGRTDILAVVTIFLFPYFIVTPAIGGVFIAGFLAPRASWLLGGIVGLVSAACYSFLVIGGFMKVAPTATSQNLVQEVTLAAFVMSPLVGAVFASAAAWYRRFLQLSNPNRGRSRPSASEAGRRPDGRTRAGGNQKASARR